MNPNITEGNVNPEDFANQEPEGDCPAAPCSAWLPAEEAPKGDTVIVGDAETTGAGWHNGRGQWFVYGSSIPMETPTHYMPFPSPPNTKDNHE